MWRIYLRLFVRYWKMNVARESQYRANMISVFVVGIFEALLTIFPMLLIYSYTDSLRGWSAGEAIALTGLFRVGLGIYMMVAGNGLAQLSSDVEDGKLDLLLIRPVSAQFIITFRFFSLPQITNIAIGAAIFAIGLSRSDLHYTGSGWLQASLLFVCGLVLVTCAISAGSYLAFRTTTIEGLPWMLYDVMEMGRYPVSFYPFAARAFLTAIMPVAFVTTLPMQAIRDSDRWLVVFGALAFAALAVLALLWWWHNNVRHYSSASS